jgi:uncharacterized membrane protein
MNYDIGKLAINLGPFYVNGYPVSMMIWNLFLAALPFLFFFLLDSYWKKTKFKTLGQKIGAVIIFFFWLIFLPNSAYLIVGIRHLIGFCPLSSPNSICVPGAWEIMVFFVHSVFGWIFFVIFLRLMEKFFAEVFSKKVSRYLLLIMIPLVSLGVLLGLTERYNSWDIFLRPLAISLNLLRYFSDWRYFWNFLIFTAGFYWLYFFGNFLFRKNGD